MGRLVLNLAIAVGAALWLPTGAGAAFGLSTFETSFSTLGGSPETQAGSHPFAFTTSFEANADGDETEGRLKQLLLDLPPGLSFDSGATPRCAQVNFLSGTCSPSTVVGSATIEADEPGLFEATRIYALAPGEGELLRLGFEVAGIDDVLVGVSLAPEPPHNPIAVLGEWPETFDVFGAELELWGVPALPAHDGARGDSVAGPALPFLTLPTRCDGPLATFFEASSWSAASDAGEVFSPGQTGCGSLAFLPSLAIEPTTQAAQSPTGLDLSLAFNDEGLGSPDGLAESQLRDLIIALPEGMSVDPSAGAAEVCTASELHEEAPEAAEGEGCPPGSAVGTLEVESPLLEGEVLHGAIYQAGPVGALGGGDPWTLYAVLKDAGLGIAIKQLVEVEPDPATGQLVAYAEDLPQLPFSRLDLSLFGEESPLVSPPRCGDYEFEAELAPWADNGDYLIRPELSFDSGPGGGPCPTEPDTVPSSGGAPSPAATALPTLAVTPPTLRRPAGRCSRSKRLVRRNGKRRCVRRCRKGKRAVRRKGKLRCVKTKRKKHRKHHRRRR